LIENLRITQLLLLLKFSHIYVYIKQKTTYTIVDLVIQIFRSQLQKNIVEEKLQKQMFLAKSIFPNFILDIPFFIHAKLSLTTKLCLLDLWTNTIRYLAISCENTKQTW